MLLLSGLLVLAFGAATAYGHHVAQRYRQAALALGARDGGTKGAEESSTRRAPKPRADQAADDGNEYYEEHLLRDGDETNHLDVGSAKRIIIFNETKFPTYAQQETAGVERASEGDLENTWYGTVRTGRRTQVGASELVGGAGQMHHDGAEVTLAKTPRAGLSVLKEEAYTIREFDAGDYHVEMETAVGLDVGVGVSLPANGGAKVTRGADGSMEVEVEGSVDVMKVGALGLGTATAGVGLVLALCSLGVGARLRLKLTPKSK
ncbi:MAG: hypothetical protein HZA54_06180 [Planctomycetes bacterium]|nr:hypothetical protein [Planctomycetota bacterium]